MKTNNCKDFLVGLSRLSVTWEAFFYIISP
jgi:hypothetical protein